MGLSTLERRSSPENPSTSLSNPAPWLNEALGSIPTHSGVAVNERTAMYYAAAFACINVLSKDVGQLPVFVYKRNGEERSPDREHEIWRVMHDRPNPMMTPSTFKRTLQAHAVAWGNGYAEIEYDNSGKVLNLWPLLPDRTDVRIRDGEKFIVTRIDDSRTNTDVNDGNSGGLYGGASQANVSGGVKWVGIPADRVVHIMGLGFDGLKGYSVIHMARNAIGAGMAAEEFSSRLFSNGATPRFALMHPKTLSSDARERLRLDFAAAYSGLSNAHRTAVLEEGLTIEKLGLPAKDAEMIETSRFGIEQMARFFDIPMMRLHSSAPITSWGTGLEQWQRAYLIHTLGPWLVQWEETINWVLFTEKERPLYYAEFLREALLQGDITARADFYQKLFMVAGISPNQIARKENMPTMGPAGDERFVPLNMVPLSQATAPRQQPIGTQTPLPSGNATGSATDSASDPENEPTPGDNASDPADEPPAKRSVASTVESRSLAAPFVTDRHERVAQSHRRIESSYVRVYEQAMRRVVSRQTVAAGRAVERLAKDQNVGAFTAWAREFFTGEQATIRDAYLPVTLALGEIVAAAALEEIASSVDVTHEVTQFASTYVEAAAIRESNRSIGQLIAILDQEPSIAGAVPALTARLTEWDTNRAHQIAANEAVQAGNAFVQLAYERAGVTRMVWISDNGCEFCQALHGRVTTIGTPFLSDGQTLTGIAGGSFTVRHATHHGPLHHGCTCQIASA